MRRSRARAAAFTTVEIMAVIAVIGVTMVVALPRLARSRRADAALNYADNLARALDRARFRAVATRRAYRVRLTPSAAFAEFDNGGVWTLENQVQAGSTGGMWNLLGARMDLSNSTPSSTPHEIRYNPDFTISVDNGAAVNANIYIGDWPPTGSTSTYYGPKYVIFVAATGAVRKWDHW